MACGLHSFAMHFTEDQMNMTIPAHASMSRRRLLTSAATLPVALGASSCGYLLYPGRRGSTSGSIDVPVLIVDLLWFLPGLLPGAICLIVDFASGCIYQGGGATRPADGTQTKQAIATVDVDGVIVASGHLGADGKAVMSWSASVDKEVIKQRGRLVMHHGGARAEAQVSQLI